MNSIKSAKKIGLVYLGLLLIGFLPNCVEPDAGGGVYQLDYLITDIALKSYVIKLNQDSIVINRKPGISIGLNEFYGLDIVFIDSITQTIRLSANNSNSSNKAVATEPTIFEYNLVNEIDSIKIKTLNDLDIEYYKGKDVSSLFYFFTENYYFHINYDEYPTPFRSDFGEFNSPYANHKKLSNIDLLLFNTTKEDSIMQFEVSVFFNNSTVIVLKTEEIMIN